jgi:hypothetical protein
MKAKGRKEEFRVVVYPSSPTDYGYVSVSRGFVYGRGEEAQRRWERDMQECCEEIASQIRRHVDNVGSVQIECEQGDVCSYCGSKWTEDSDTYNGGCCEQDEEHAPSETEMA